MAPVVAILPSASAASIRRAASGSFSITIQSTAVLDLAVGLARTDGTNSVGLSVARILSPSPCDTASFFSSVTFGGGGLRHADVSIRIIKEILQNRFIAG